MCEERKRNRVLASSESDSGRRIKPVRNLSSDGPRGLSEVTTVPRNEQEFLARSRNPPVADDATVPCQGNTGYLTWDSAKSAIGRNVRGGLGGANRVTPFRCRYCGFWHLGHK